jgi:transcription antitermination factor NusG
MNIKNEQWKPDDMANRPGGLTVDHTLDKMADNAKELELDYEPEKAQEPVAYIKDRELGYMLAVREVGAKEWRTNLGLYPEKGDVPLYTAPPPAFQEIEELNELYMAAKNVIAWTEATHRPPVCDAFETGQMVKVRLHALADLQDAIEAVREKNNVR